MIFFDNKTGHFGLNPHDDLRAALKLNAAYSMQDEKQIFVHIKAVDFAPTVLDYAGIEIPMLMQGESMRPLFEGNAGGWRESVFYEYWVDLVHSIPTMNAADGARSCN